MIDSCETCRFFEPTRRPDNGVCRRYPPVVIPAPTGPEALHPAVWVGGWCGEYETTFARTSLPPVPPEHITPEKRPPGRPRKAVS